MKKTAVKNKLKQNWFDWCWLRSNKKVYSMCTNDRLFKDKTAKIFIGFTAGDVNPLIENIGWLLFNG